MSELTELVYNSTEQLDAWISCNGWAGYDPYDLKGIPLFLKRNPTFFEKAVKKVSLKVESFAPHLLRNLPC